MNSVPISRTPRPQVVPSTEVYNSTIADNIALELSNYDQNSDKVSHENW